MVIEKATCNKQPFIHKLTVNIFNEKQPLKNVFRIARGAKTQALTAEEEKEVENLLSP